MLDRPTPAAIPAKIARRVDAIDSMLSIGLDSDLRRLPSRFVRDPQPQLAFNRWIIEQTADLALAYKPNLAFYEARGAAGWHELALTTDILRREHPGTLLIADAKRADIDSTNEASVRAIFDDLGCDAVTLHPWLGGAALEPYLARADKACIIVCRTSNPGASELQDLPIDGRPLWEHLAVRVRDEWDRHGTCMLVIGATWPEELRRARVLCPGMSFLVPGVGAQGGEVEAAVAAGRDAQGRGLIVNASRSVIFADDPRAAALALRDRIRSAAAA